MGTPQCRPESGIREAPLRRVGINTNLWLSAADAALPHPSGIAERGFL